MTPGVGRARLRCHAPRRPSRCFSAMRSAASTLVILIVTEEERSRQSGDRPGIELDLERSGEDSDPVLWLPNGLAADEHELVAWLSRERAERGG